MTAEADKLYKEAERLCRPSIFAMRFGAEWERALPLFEQAAAAYKRAGDNAKAKVAFEKAAEGMERMRSPAGAAKHLEKAGELAYGEGKADEAADFFRRAAEAYSSCGRHQAGAESLSRGAALIGGKDPEAAGQLYREALDALEADGKEALAGDTFRAATALQIKHERYGEAAELLLRFAAACEGFGARAGQCKAYLGAVIVHLYAQNMALAFATYQDALEVDNFRRSDEASVAESLFDAYRSGDASAVRTLLDAKSALIYSLDNQVARLARKLPTGDVASLGHQLGGGGDDGFVGDATDDYT